MEETRPGTSAALKAADLYSLLEEVYGAVDWRAASGVLQVTAIAAADRATIALGPEAPASALDRIVLGFARARAEALVTTGSILRAEPKLVHRYAEDPTRDEQWQAWREATLGWNGAPGLILLSRSGDFPLGHPAIESATSGFVWTSKATRDRLGPRLGALEVVVAESTGGESGLSGALAFARARHGLSSIAIEAGPSATRGIYEPPATPPETGQNTGPARVAVDELLLSLYDGALADAARAAKFASEAEVSAAGLQRVRTYKKKEPSGSWTFERYRSRAVDFG